MNKRIFFTLACLATFVAISQSMSLKLAINSNNEDNGSIGDLDYGTICKTNNQICHMLLNECCPGYYCAKDYYSDSRYGGRCYHPVPLEIPSTIQATTASSGDLSDEDRAILGDLNAFL